MGQKCLYDDKNEIYFVCLGRIMIIIIGIAWQSCVNSRLSHKSFERETKPPWREERMPVPLPT